MPCRHYIVAGRVQGVFFRASARDQAQVIGLRGWVKNLADGRVEAIACGNLLQLDKFELWLKQGPEMAQVSEVIVDSVSQEENFDGFSIKN